MAYMFHKVVEVTPVIDTGAYTAADQVGETMTLAGVCDAPSTGAVLRQVTIIDKAKQKAAITVFLFDEAPTVASVNNAAANVTDAQMADKAIGAVAVAAGDYQDLSGSSTATKAALIYVKPIAASTVYALAVTTGTPTYGSTSDLVFRFHFTWE